MKKYLLTISAMLMLLVTGCELFPPDDSQTQPIVVEAPAISGKSVTDTSMTATIAPVAGTGFYSYAVMAGPRQTLDPATLLGVDYSNAIISGTAQYTEENPSLTIYTDGLDRNVWYYIYAVAASEQGVPSEITVDSVYTTNSLTPNITGQFSTDTASVIFAVPFTENVSLSGSGNVYVSYFKVNDLADSVNTKKQVVPTDSISVDGNVLYVSVPDKTPGLYITLSWDAGILVNSAGTPNPAWTNDYYNKQNLRMRAGREAWNLDYQIVRGEDGDTTYYAADSLFTFLPEEAPAFYAWFTPEKEIVAGSGAVRVTVNSPNGDVLSYDDEILGFSADGDVAVGISRSLTAGDRLVYSFPAGTFQDVYGNPNAAFTTEEIYMCSYGYAPEDIEGEYQGIGTSYFDGLGYYLNFDDPMNVNIEIEVVDVNLGEEFDNFEANVVIRNLMYTDSEVYGYFDTMTGTISIPGGQYIASNEDGSQDYYFMSDHSPVIWNMPIKGNVNSQELWGYYVYSAGNGLGYYDAFAATQLTLIQEGTQASKASASPVNKRDLTISELHTL